MKKVKLIFCAVCRHSHLLTNCFGYKYCARCGEQLGDTLADGPMITGYGGFFLIGQKCTCKECRQAFDTLTWMDRFLCPKATWPEGDYVQGKRESANQ